MLPAYTLTLFCVSGGGGAARHMQKGGRRPSLVRGTLLRRG
eukprot:gene35106-63910_t